LYENADLNGKGMLLVNIIKKENIPKLNLIFDIDRIVVYLNT